MKKVTELNFSAFFELYEILKLIFKEYKVSYEDNEDENGHGILISPAEDDERNVFLRLCHASLLPERGAPAPDYIPVRLINPIGNDFFLDIKKDCFEDEECIKLLKNFLEMIVPMPGSFPESESFIKNLIEESGMAKFCVQILQWPDTIIDGSL